MAHQGDEVRSERSGPLRVTSADRRRHQVADEEEVSRRGLQLPLGAAHSALDDGGLLGEETRPVGSQQGAILEDESEDEQDRQRQHDAQETGHGDA
jgi:hypothetical protein